jgi:hypothetical protein
MTPQDLHLCKTVIWVSKNWAKNTLVDEEEGSVTKTIAPFESKSS